ncbi:MAG: hypothetical protein ACI9WU_005383, partial [Myxococcota bacterium]
MSRRRVVSHHCPVRCASCVGCHDDDHAPSLREAQERLGDSSEVVLGGGDATRWRHLPAFLQNAAGSVWVEAPPAALTDRRAARLKALGATGVLIHISQADDALIDRVEAHGLQTRLRLLAGPDTAADLVGYAATRSPRSVWLELDSTGPVDRSRLEAAMLQAANVAFSGHRIRDRGFVPPCHMPRLWARRPSAWRSLLSEDRVEDNATLPQCGTCVLKRRCRFSEPAAHSSAVPVASLPPWMLDRPDSRRLAPAVLRKPAAGPEVICTTPWTTLEMTTPDGRVHQCCRSWTIGDRGRYPTRSLTEIWNGPGFQAARQTMAGGATQSLCASVCPRLHDGEWKESALRLRPGSPRFEANQALLVEELAARRTVLTAKPLFLALAPSTYCNYDCLMCECGRTPTQAVRPELWDEVEALLPTLSRLSLLGGEPLASQSVMRFLQRYNRAAYPDARVHLVTNGSLLTASALKQLDSCAFGGVTVSLNAATAETYERVHRGVPLSGILANIDALIAHRAAQPAEYHFAINLSFVVMPDNIDDLVPFGVLAAERGLDIRLLPLSPDGPGGAECYGDESGVARLVDGLDAFGAWARRFELRYLRTIAGARAG